MAEKTCDKCKITQSLNMFIGGQNKIIAKCRKCMKNNSEIIPYINKCTSCKIEKPLERFITNKDVFIKRCRDCTKEKDREELPPGMKRCIKDHPLYPAEKNGKSAGCPVCREIKKGYETKKKDEAIEMGILRCDKCGRNSEKDGIDIFVVNPKGGYNKLCIDCGNKSNECCRKRAKKYKENSTDPELALKNLRHCSGCGYPHDISAFTYEDGTISKRGSCIHRLELARKSSKKRMDNLEYRQNRNKQNREGKYYVTYRQRLRAKLGDIAYKKMMTDKHTDWIYRNPDHVKNYQNNTVSICIADMKLYAAKRGILWDITDEDIEFMAILPCFYCGIEYTNKLHNPNRLDNTKGFIRSNTVPSCSMCALMKKALDVNTFIERCEYICGMTTERNEDIWSNSRYVYYNDYKKRAEKKGLEFSITEEEFDEITKNPCIYCNKRKAKCHRNGIDRYDNNIGYTIENCVSCCFGCNTMKWNFTYDQFIHKCQTIANKNHRIIENIVPNNRSAIRNTTLLREHNITNTAEDIDNIDDIDNIEGILILEDEQEEIN